MLGKGEGQFIRPFRFAPGFPYIQTQAPTKAFRIVIDIDEDVRGIARSNGWTTAYNVPEPSYVLLNPLNGHAHVFFELEAPVALYDGARMHPLRYFAAAEDGLRRALRGDRGYAGFLCKNPWNDAWECLPGRLEKYTLGELIEYRQKPEATEEAVAEDYDSGTLRNCKMFDRLRKWAYTEVSGYSDRAQWSEVVFRQAQGINTFSTPLEPSEVRAIARSVAKWTWTRFGQGVYAERFSETQKHRQKLGAAKKRAVTTTDVVLAIASLRSAGKRVSKTAVAKIVGCSQQNLSKHYSDLF